MNLIHRARQIWVEQGPVGFWFRSLEKLGYRRVQLWQLDLTALPLTSRVGRIPAGVDTSWLTADDYDAFLRWRTDLAREDFQERLVLGDRCWLAKQQQQPIACAWVSTRQARYLCDRFPLAPHEAYLYDMFVAPAWRGRGLACALLVPIASALATERYRSLTLAIYPENKPARRAYQKAGFQPVALCIRVQLGRWRRDWRFHYRLATNAPTTRRAAS